MAFYITKPGNPNLTILTDGGSLQIGTGLLVDNNGKLNVTGEGVATDVFFSNILGEPTDNQKLAELLSLKANTSDLLDYIHINGTTETLDAKQINFYATDDGETRIVGNINSRRDGVDSPIVIESNEGIEFRESGSNDILSFELPNVHYQIAEELLTTSWPDIINTANGQSEAYAKSTEVALLVQKLEDKELVVSSALNDLNNRLLDTYNKEEVEENFVNKTDFDETSLVISAALTDLDSRLLEIPNSYYTKEEIDEMIQNLINTYHSE